VTTSSNTSTMPSRGRKPRRMILIVASRGVASPASRLESAVAPRSTNSPASSSGRTPSSDMKPSTIASIPKLDTSCIASRPRATPIISSSAPGRDSLSTVST